MSTLIGYDLQFLQADNDAAKSDNADITVITILQLFSSKNRPASNQINGIAQ